MFNIDNFTVYIDNTDISAMVTSMTLYESIHGNLKGTMHIDDKLNIFELFFRGVALTSVRISYTYFEVPTDIILYADGVIDQIINKQGKTYNVNLISVNNMNEAVERICGVYSGTSNEILGQLWAQTHGVKNILALDSECSSKGKYVVPNISAKEAMLNVVNSSYDKHYTGMFLYQRLVDNGVSRFTSIHDMVHNKFLSAYYENFRIHSEEIIMNETTGVSSTIGSTSNFKLTDYNNNFISKLSGGMWGQKITEIDISETTDKVLPIKEKTDIEITKLKLNPNLYETESSLFSPESLITEEIISNMKYRLFNTTLLATNVVAVPGIGCGMITEVAQGEGQISNTKTDGTYLIANINHRFIMEDGEMEYSQNIGLVREGLV